MTKSATYRTTRYSTGASRARTALRRRKISLRVVRKHAVTEANQSCKRRHPGERRQLFSGQRSRIFSACAVTVFRGVFAPPVVPENCICLCRGRRRVMEPA
jgi:hypothetical protein